MARILVVDDSSTQAKILSRMIQNLGHDTIVSNSGEQGIALSHSEKPDMVIMDVVMPDVNGFQATRKISQHPATEHIPIILVSAKDQETDRLWGERQGAKGYLVKPVDPSLLAETLDQFLAFA